MGLGYQLAYAIGVTPWERAGDAGAQQLQRLVAKEEASRGGPGRALDLGCGSGAHAVTLAARGWSVTGIDLVGKALARARNRADEHGAQVTFIQADVTRLDSRAVGAGYDFLLDIGCFHGLTVADQAAMGRSIETVAAPDATLLVLAFTPGATKCPLPRGADAASIEQALPGWRVMETEPAVTEGMPAPLRKAAPTWYRVSRAS
jgi:cyclopropane fatty-acyl-phospholipid synthase-like methyltransferase